MEGAVKDWFALRLLLVKVMLLQRKAIARAQQQLWFAEMTEEHTPIHVDLRELRKEKEI